MPQLEGSRIPPAAAELHLKELEGAEPVRKTGGDEGLTRHGHRKRVRFDARPPGTRVALPRIALASAFVVMLAGLAGTRRIARTPPMLVLRHGT
jgi:hypothetical protein